VSLGSSINAFHDFAGDRVGGNQICYRKAATRSTLVEWLARIANYGTYGIQQIKLWVNRTDDLANHRFGQIQVCINRDSLEKTEISRQEQPSELPPSEGYSGDPFR
jgi:hypothetical protein